MPDSIAYTVLCREIGLPFSEAGIALAYVPYKSQLNKHMYDTREALDALEAHFDRKAAENHDKYSRYQKSVYRDRARRAEEQVARIKNWRAEHEQRAENQ